MIEFTIENIVASTTLASSLDLALVAKTMPESTYNPQETPAVILQKTSPIKAVIFFYSNGMLSCTGPKNLHDAETIINTTSTLLKTAGLPITEKPEIMIQTIVASYELQHPLNLRSIAKLLQTRCSVEYNPKQFPGIIYKQNDTNTIILLFETGKMICTGTNTEHISSAIERLKIELASCKEK